MTGQRSRSATAFDTALDRMGAVVRCRFTSRRQGLVDHVAAAGHGYHRAGASGTDGQHPHGRGVGAGP